MRPALVTCSITALRHSIVSTANFENTLGTRLPKGMLSKWQRLWKRKRRRQKSLLFAVGFTVALKDSRCDPIDWRGPDSQQHHWQSSALGSNDPPNGTAFYPSSNGGGTSSKGYRRIRASGWWTRKRWWEVRINKGRKQASKQSNSTNVHLFLWIEIRAEEKGKR